MSNQWTEARVQREILATAVNLAKRSGCTISLDVELITPLQRAEALAKASSYRELAEQITDRVTADGYRELARREREKAGIA